MAPTSVLALYQWLDRARCWRLVMVYLGSVLVRQSQSTGLRHRWLPDCQLQPRQRREVPVCAVAVEAGLHGSQHVDDSWSGRLLKQPMHEHWPAYGSTSKRIAQLIPTPDLKDRVAA